MIIPDSNLLVYAASTSAPAHDAAREWWQRVLNAREPIGLAWHTLLAYIRIMSDPRIMTTPAQIDQLLDDVDDWLSQPNVVLIRPGDNHVQALRSMCRTPKVTGRLVPDAHLAALAITYRGTIYSADKDFADFTDIRWVNPLDD